MKRVRRFSLVLSVAFASSAAFVAAPDAQPRRGAPAAAPATPRAAAPFDITGHWVSLITGDWVYRMITPAKGDVSYVPPNPAGRRVADAREQARDEAAGEQRKGNAAPAHKRLASRVEVALQEDHTATLDL